MQDVRDIQKMYERGSRKAEQETLFFSKYISEQHRKQNREEVAFVHLDAEHIDRKHKDGRTGENGIVAL